RNHNVFDNASWIRGRHAVKFGFGYNHYQKNENAAGSNAGSLTFGSQNVPAMFASETPAQRSTQRNEQDFANFLIGFASSNFTQSPLDLTADIRQNLWEFYGQDEFR